MMHQWFPVDTFPVQLYINDVKTHFLTFFKTRLIKCMLRIVINTRVFHAHNIVTVIIFTEGYAKCGE